MELFWIIYLVDVLDISEGASVIAVFSFIFFFVGKVMVSSLDGDYNFNEGPIKFAKLLSSKGVWLTGVILMVTAIVLPNKETSYEMLAAYGVTEAYTAAQESDKVQAIAGKSLKVLEKAMDSYLDEEVK